MKIEKIRELAPLFGIQTTYEDASGVRRSASRDSLMAILRARAGHRDLEEALRERKARKGEPVVVAWDGKLGSEMLPFGYHVRGETLIISAPRQAFVPSRAWGIFAPLYAMRTQRSWGAGDLGDLQAYRERLGAGIIATLPMLAVDADDPSPYSPLSRLFWNEMYLDVERLREFDPADRDDATIAALQSSDRVDYCGVMREKRRVLEKMLTRFRPDAGYERFAKNACGYAKFRAQTEDGGPRSEEYHLYVQYRMEQQIREVSRGLYLDFPLGVNPNGYDASRYASVFAKGVTVGAPPDLFFTKGQNWGFAPFDPDAIREEHYDYFRACIAHHAAHASALRIDHVMGLHRLFWIPEGGEPKDGVYVRYCEEEMYAIVVLESNRHRCAIVGEDLGTVPQYVPAMMKRHGLRRMYVVQYEEKIGDPPEQSVASVNTHDMPAFAGFCQGRDIDERVEQGLLSERAARKEREKRRKIRQTMTAFLKARGLLQDDDTRSILDALLRFLAASSAEIVLVNLEDLWLETEPQNRPGLPERSWRQKFMFPLEQMMRDTKVTAILGSVGEQRRKVDGDET